MKKVSRTVSVGWLEGVSAQVCSGKEAVGLSLQIQRRAQRCGVTEILLSKVGRYVLYLSAMTEGANVVGLVLSHHHARSYQGRTQR